MGRLYRIILWIALLIPACGWSQKMDCEQTIAHATEEFNAGHFYSIPAILNECLKSFSREQRQRAFLLLTQTYLLLDDPIGADKSFLEILSANPEFIADDQLHAIDIVYLSKKFTATPKFSWFVNAGSNVSRVRVIRDNYLMHSEKEKYSFRPGYHAGIGGEYGYDDNFKVSLELDYLHTSFKSQIIDYFDYDFKDYIDRQSWINIPLYVSYADHIGKYRPYGYAGYSFSWMLNDQGSIAITKVTTEEGTGEGEQRENSEKQSPDLDLLESRNRLNQSIIFGGGIRYKVGLDFIFAELRYSVGLKNIVNPDRLYANYAYDQVSGEWIKTFEPTAAYLNLDDYFRLDNLSISFGFLRPLYKPREWKRARTKGVLRKMKNSK